MTKPPIHPPPRPDATPRMKASRVEALRAAAKVHEGIGLYDGASACAPVVLDTARAFELWLLEQDA